MPFIYKFLIDNEEVDVEIGFSTSRKWEEALDEASVVVPFSYLNEKPYKMFSLLEIEINEIDNYTDRNVIDTKKRTYLIYSDRVEAVGSYGYFRHNVNAIEYTAKLDYYFINQLAKSRSIIKNTPAPFTSNIYRTEQTVSGGKRYGVNVVLENIKVNENYKTNETIRFEKVNEASVFRYFYPDGIEDDYYVKRQTAIRATNTLLNITTETHILSNNPIEYNLEKGEWKIEYGFIGLAKDVVYGSPYVEGFNVSHTFYIEIVDNTDLSMYDIVNEIRDMISKFGGIEDTIYYDTTRIFNIDTDFEDLLKKTQAPQIYLNGTTARQMLIYALSFINALPRLEYNADDLDLLTLEMYNLSVGDYETEDVVGFGSQQNTNQIGTKNYQVISQALSNNLDDASITTPSNNAFQTVRSKDIQITKDNFVLKLVEDAPLYMPIKLEVYVPKIKITGNEPGTQITTLYEKDDFVLDLTSRFINSEEWKLKVTTDNFYNIDMTEPMKQNSGMRLNKVENISWNIGDTEINLSQSFGVVWQDNLIKSVVVSALNEYFTLNLPPVDFVDASNERQALFYGLEYTLPNDYKDWKFRVEYITDERLVIKQDKEDISQVSFYSEMRQNQEESLVDLVRQSKKAYGDLQRTGNIAFSFVKKHTKFSEFYEVGEKDKDDYTITQIDTQWFNDYALSTYSVTQYHNRIQQATFVNQKYRPFDNYTKNVLNRHEHYGDYLIAVPPDFIEILEQPTKIYSNDKTVRQISDILLGKTHKLNDNVSVALIRTDGMLEENPDGIYTTNFISTPVTSRGIKGGFAFTFGFSGNMVAGDGLVQKGSNWYNSAVRYTDKKGRFTRFGFMLLNELEIGGDDAYIEYPLLKIPNTEVFDEESDFHKRISFWCRFPYLPDGYVDALVWNKDPLTNASLTYQLNVLSYYMGLYVFGMSFFTENFIVKKYNLDNIENFIGAKLYIYKNNMKYALFEDIYIKGGYYQEIELNASNIEFNPLNNEITFKNINLDGVTSWAIGLPQKDGSTPKLLVACNENLNGIKFIKRHARPNVLEIGEKEIERRYAKIDGIVFEFNVDFAMNRIDSILFDLDTALYIGEMVFEYLRSKNIGFTSDRKLTQTISLTYVANYGGVINSDISTNSTTDLSFVLGKSIVKDITTALFFGDLEFNYLKSKNIGIILDSYYYISYDIEYFNGLSIPYSLSLEFGLSTNIEHKTTAGIPLFFTEQMTTSTNLIHISSQGIPLDMNLSSSVDVPVIFHKSKDLGFAVNYKNFFMAEILHYIGDSKAIEIPIQTLKQNIDIFYKSSYGVPLSDNILVNAIADINIVIGKILEQTLNNSFIFSIESLDYRKSKDLGLLLNNELVLTSQILHFIGESMPLTILIQALASAEIEHKTTAGIPLFFTEQMTTSTNLIHISSQGIPLDMNLSSSVDVPVIFHKTKDIGSTLNYNNIFMTEITHYVGNSIPFMITGNILKQTIDMLYSSNKGIPLNIDVISNCEIDMNFIKTHDIGLQLNNIFALTSQLYYYVGDSQEENLNIGYSYIQELDYVVSYGQHNTMNANSQVEVIVGFWKTKDIGNYFELDNKLTYDLDFVTVKIDAQQLSHLLQMNYDLRYVTHKPKNLVLTLDVGLGISSDLDKQVVPPIQTVFNITTSKGTGVSSLAIIPNSYTRNDTSTQNFTISRTFATGYEENTATITRIQPYGGQTPVISGNSIIVYSKSYGDFLFTQTAKLKQYTITWNANGGTLSKISETIQHGKTPTAPTGTRSGYYLSGFSPTIYSANKDQTYIAQWTEGTYTPPPSAVVNCLNGTMYIDITNNSSQSEIIYINNVSYGLLAGNTTYRYYMEDWSGMWHPYSYDIKAGSSTTITVSGSQRVCISSD